MNLFETMECRRLLSSATLVRGDLDITGTQTADTVEVWPTKNGKNLIVSLNGSQSTFPARNLREIEIDTYAGNDRITISERIIIETDIDAGAGDDYIFGGSGRDEIDGGSGNDTIFGNGGADDIEGGSGIDVITGGTGRDTFDREDASEIVDFSSRRDRWDD